MKISHPLAEAARKAGVFRAISLALTEAEDFARQERFLEDAAQVLAAAQLEGSEAAALAYHGALELLAHHATYTYIGLQIQRQELASSGHETPEEARQTLLAYCHEALRRSFPSEAFFRGYAFLGACALYELLHPPEQALAQRKELFAQHTERVGQVLICEQELQEVPLALVEAGFDEASPLQESHWRAARAALEQAHRLRSYLDFGYLISPEVLIDLAAFYRGRLRGC